jgi:radical SAM superfamily enzyme
MSALIPRVRDQLARGITGARRRKAHKVIAYFQAYTNTYGPLDRLRALYDEAWRFPEVAGLAIGTRPDCVDPTVIDLVAGYVPRGEVWLEYGLQSAHDSTLAPSIAGTTTSASSMPSSGPPGEVSASACTPSSACRAKTAR